MVGYLFLNKIGAWGHRLVVYLVVISILFFIGLALFKKLSNSSKILVALIGLGLASDIVARFIAAATRYSTPGYHLYIPLQYFLLALFYGIHLKKYGLWFSYSPLLMLVLAILNTIYFQSIWAIPSNMVLICSLSYIIYALITFNYLLNNVSEVSLLKSDLFWSNAITLAYFTCTFFCWSFYNFFVKKKINTTLIADIIYYANHIYYLTLGMAIIMNSRKKKNVK